MNNLFVGNLSFQTTEEDLRSLFEAFGEITRVQLMKDRDTGRSRGFGFVEMAEDESAEKAMGALNGKEVQGRTLTVNEARPKPERTRFGGGNSRGGFGRNDFGWSGRQRREPRW
jgi:RNA recognition motif-containing protein